MHRGHSCVGGSLCPSGCQAKWGTPHVAEPWVLGEVLMRGVTDGLWCSRNHRVRTRASSDVSKIPRSNGSSRSLPLELPSGEWRRLSGTLNSRGTIWIVRNGVGS